LSLSMGMVSYDAQQPCPVEALLDRADELMYEDKQQRHRGQECIPSSKGGKIQRRAHERHEAGDIRDARLVLAGETEIRNISVSGISVRTAQRLTKDTTYHIRITGPEEEELFATGVVVWSSFIGKGSEKSESELYYEAGLRFTDQREDLKRSLDKFISSRTRRDS